MNKPRTKNPTMGITRLEMFSDGVFAIAITLLILEIKIPTHQQVLESGGLYNYLLQLWPNYLSYVLSFTVIGVYWSNHHHALSYVIKKTDHYFNLINLFFLMTIAFIPFTTAILGDFLNDEHSFGAAVSALCIGYFFPIPMVLFMFLYAKHKKRLIDPSISDGFLRKQIIKLLVSMAFTIVSIAFSFFYPMVSFCMILGSFVLYLLPPDMPEYKEENT